MEASLIARLTVGVALVIVAFALAVEPLGATVATPPAYDGAVYDYDVDPARVLAQVVVSAGVERTSLSLEDPNAQARGTARHVSDSSLDSSAPIVVPRGFGNAADFGAFGDDLYSGLRGAGYADVTAIFQGSSVTGQSFRTGAAFDGGRVSDFDIALASPRLLDRASALGIGLRSGGTRTGPLTASQLQQLGLGNLATDLGTAAGRPRQLHDL